MAWLVSNYQKLRPQLSQLSQLAPTQGKDKRSGRIFQQLCLEMGLLEISLRKLIWESALQGALEVYQGVMSNNFR